MRLFKCYDVLWTIICESANDSPWPKDENGRHYDQACYQFHLWPYSAGWTDRMPDDLSWPGTLWRMGWCSISTDHVWKHDVYRRATRDRGSEDRASRLGRRCAGESFGGISPDSRCSVLSVSCQTQDARCIDQHSGRCGTGSS